MMAENTILNTTNKKKRSGRVQTSRKSTWNWLLVLTNLGALTPILWFAWQFWQGSFAVVVNPIQEATFRTGEAAIILIGLSLACTPIHTIFNWRQVLSVRKTLGLYGFAYVCLHLLIFVVDNGFFGDRLEIAPILEATFEKPYALVGFIAFLLLIPLAITSTKGWMKRLKRNWKRLHRLTYIVGVLAVIHFYMVRLIKVDLQEPFIYGGVLVFLLIVRLPAIRKWITQYRNQMRKVLAQKRQAA